MKDYYRQLIVDMLPNIRSERFLRKIYLIIKRHIEKNRITKDELEAHM